MTLTACRHTLIVYRTSAEADETLRRLWRAARDDGRHVTVVALAAEERTTSGCCDTRSVLWNRMCREMAREELARAGNVVEHDAGVDFDIVIAPAGRAAEALSAEALACGAEEIVLADPRCSGLGRLELRRLRRKSRVPLS